MNKKQNQKGIEKNILCLNKIKDQHIYCTKPQNQLWSYNSINLRRFSLPWGRPLKSEEVRWIGGWGDQSMGEAMVAQL